MEACEELKVASAIPEISKDVHLTKSRWEDLNEDLQNILNKLYGYKQGLLCCYILRKIGVEFLQSLCFCFIRFRTEFIGVV